MTAPNTRWDIAEVLEGLGFFYDRSEQQLNLRGNPRLPLDGADFWLHPNNGVLEVSVGTGANTGWGSFVWKVIEAGLKIAEGIDSISLSTFFERFDELID